MKSFSRVRLFVTPWTIAYQAPLSVGFSRQEYWSGVPFPTPAALSHPGTEPVPPALQADTLPAELRLLLVHIIYLFNLPPEAPSGRQEGCQASTAARRIETTEYETRETAVTTCHGAEDRAHES